MSYTGIQYTPVASIAALVTLQATSQSARRTRSLVNVLKDCTGHGSRSGGTATKSGVVPAMREDRVPRLWDEDDDQELTGPTGHMPSAVRSKGNPRLTPSLGLELGGGDARVEARADLFRIDLVTGAALALPSLGLWAAAGRAGSPILDITNPAPAHADTLRIGFALDAQRRLNFVLAADTVTLGAHSYATLDLTSPDAVMDALGNTVGDIANLLLAGLGDARR